MIELCEKVGFNIVGIIDSALEGYYLGYPILGTDNDAENIYSKYGDCKLVLTPDSPIVREKLVRLYKPIGWEFATIISPYSKISKYATIGEGTIIQDGVNVSAFTKIGNYVKLNTNANIMHDNNIGDFVTVAPNAVSLGRITIGMSSYVGANATILPEVIVGHHSVIGAGSVVTKRVLDNTIIKGVPAK